MAAITPRTFALSLALLTAISCATIPRASAALSTKHYDKTCPALQSAVRSAMARAIATDPRAGASVLRLFFHDCFVSGCDASVLLDERGGEKRAGPNLDSLRGYEVVDAAKAAAEAACPGVASCADVLALAARDAVELLGGPSWSVRLGRKDARAAASQADANANLPGPGSSLAAMVAAFAAKGLSARDLTALSGAHTVGRARCATFRARVDGGDVANVNATFAARLARSCAGSDGGLAPLDAETPDAFDNGYFRALVQRRGLLHSDQELFNGGSTDALVRKYANDGAAFASDFAKAMVRLGNLAPAAGMPLEVRINCRRPN